MIWKMADEAMICVNLPYAVLSYEAETVLSRRTESHRWTQADLRPLQRHSVTLMGVHSSEKGPEAALDGLLVTALPSEGLQVKLCF